VQGATSIVRIVIVALIAFGVWALVRYGNPLPPAKPVDAPATAFSAARAEDVLARILGPERPHPNSTEENAAVRERILEEYARLGIRATPFRDFGCTVNPNFGFMSCGTVTDILAELVPGKGKAVLLMAHYDSVPAGPGASDDESSVATIIESARALKARGGKTLHPVLALNTDGEESGLIGASAFLRDPARAALPGAVVNAEARGNQGESLFFQSSPGDGPLVDLYAKSVSRYATGSLFNVVYRLMPNDTDLTIFLRRGGYIDYNFAFIGNLPHYHTPLDTRADLNPQTLQTHGDAVLGIAQGLANTPFEQLKGDDAIYLEILGKYLPRLPAPYALRLALAVLGLLIAAWVASPSARRPNGDVFGPRISRGWAFAILPVTLVGAAALGWLLLEIASLVSGSPDPSHAYPTLFRASLALGTFGAAFAAARLATPRDGALATWIWIAFLATVSGALLPGLSPYYLFPALIAAPVFFLVALLFQAWRGVADDIAIVVAALPALLIQLEVGNTSEDVMGLLLYGLFAVPLALALATLMPLAHPRALSRGLWSSLALAMFAGAIVLAVAQGFEPANTARSPLRLNLSYVEDHTKNRAYWAAATNVPLPASLKAAAPFSTTAETPLPVLPFSMYTANAGAMRFAPPTADKWGEKAFGTQERRVVLVLHGSDEATALVLFVPKEAHLESVSMNGDTIRVPAAWKKLERNVIACVSSDCHNKTITLELGTRAAQTFTLIERRTGLPEDGAKLIAARPNWAVPFTQGDMTVLVNTVKLPKM
jgi:hypothetical protein